eukprot:TRINITY_DN18947_c0_g1_i1.p1 TRINITY_DN18947_c0_g1~~TRINITY_DN18947_c0_g1_i1.p1  ORF type:complete len:397 (+),score=83.48 TRINITY_DN18947_c0_g1_i1:72-1193(+)
MYWDGMGEWIVRNQPPAPKLWIDTDIGNDIDDVLAFLVVMDTLPREHVLGITTTFFRPDRKARIAKLLLREYGWPQVPVYAGVGIYDAEKDVHLMNELYRLWPPQFPLPWLENSISCNEGSAYQKHYSGFDSVTYEGHGLDKLREKIQASKGDLVLLSIGFHTNLAAVWDTIQDNSINRIVLMGGWFENPDGSMKRLGYNTVVDLEASRTLLEQTTVPVLIVGSEFCRAYGIKRVEYQALRDKAEKLGSRVISRAIMDDMTFWFENKNQKGADDVVHIGDPLAAYLACHPEEIKETVPVRVKFAKYEAGMHMFHANASSYAEVKRVSESNIHVVKSVKDPEKLRKAIVDIVSRSFDWKKLGSSGSKPLVCCSV